MEELAAIRSKMKEKMDRREANGTVSRVLVGMATCGIAAGARPVFAALAEEISSQGVEGVSVGQTGCIGICQFEPVVEVIEPGREKVTYVHMDADKAKRIVTEHLKGGTPVAEYTIGAVE
jgi:NADP-reducing hydrogenase subunit HndB